MNSMMLVTLSGPKNINLLAAMGELAEIYSASLKEIQQTRTSTRHSLHVLFEIIICDNDGNDYHRLFGDLSAAITAYAKDNACLVKVDSVSPLDLTRSAQPACRILLIGRSVSITDISAVYDVTKTCGLTFETVQWLSDRVSHTDGVNADSLPTVVEFLSSQLPASESRLRATLLQLSSDLQLDIHFQENTYDSRHRRLVCFDMDSTLINAEVIDELAKEIGAGEQVAAITESAMRGDIAFDESFRQRMALLEGVDESVLVSIAERVELNPGVEKLLVNLNKRGYKTAILSGGFDYFGRYLQNKLGIDYVYANALDIVDGKVTGKVIGNIVNGERKAELLRLLAEKEGLLLSQVVAVGDGANDLPMLALAGMGVAFRAKPKVTAAAKFNISYLGLDSILYLMGFNPADIE
ncbi:MAG: phosphoserine phosphatase [Candidatus Endobugula sp.]